MADAVFVIAEAGVNHNGDIDLARRLCDAAQAAGADAVKFQTFRAEDLVVPGAPTAGYQHKQTGEVDQFSMLRKLELSAAQHGMLKAHCDALGIEFFSTPFSVQAVDLLVALGVRHMKMPSGELTHRALIEKAAATQLRAQLRPHRLDDARDLRLGVDHQRFGGERHAAGSRLSAARRRGRRARSAPRWSPWAAWRRSPSSTSCWRSRPPPCSGTS